METLRFKADTPTRRRFFVADSFAHPAKMASGLFLECLERYSHPGEVVLDVMAGSGTALLGAMYGRSMILNELELHFLPMIESWKKIQRNGPALGYRMGEAMILRGDARMLPLPDASVDVETLSPPYEGTNDEDRRFGGIRDPTANKSGSMGRMALRYTRPQVDAIVTSPPFGEAQTGGGIAAALEGRGNYPVTSRLPCSVYSPKSHGESSANIGNMRNAAYWDAMRQVYSECWRVLKPGGILALVLKGYTRAGVYQNLPGQTEALLLEAGWVKHDEWRRELYSLSFWRILQKQRDPAAFDDRLNYEEVLSFRKPASYA